MKILKASAGSGKTYSLTREYIRLLLQSESREAYRHVLAVTFTNKATDEMKRRILKELHTLATTPENSPYINDLVPAVMSSRAELKKKAEAMMTGILHDYSSFAVSTIDKFFQQTLRAFSREIGQFTSYQVELDRDILVEDAVDRLLNTLTNQNSPLLQWILDGVKADLATTGRFTLDRRLKELAASIVSEPTGSTDYSREKLADLKSLCEDVVNNFITEVESAAATVLQTMGEAGIDPADTNRGFLKAIYGYTDINRAEFLPAPTAAFMEKAADPEKWFAKTKQHLIAPMSELVFPYLSGFCDMFRKPYKEYSTAMTILGQLYGLGVATEIRKAFVEAQKERGVISIDDTNNILHDIIDGTDTPFLYEKLGVRFDDFLLDEFQDTSTVQWDNFVPLLRNSDAEGKDNLVVGDVKQSIYRWRGSRWDLLDHRLQDEFHVPASDITVLDGNYRTCRAIVNFNNRFFPYMAAEIDRLVGNGPASVSSLRSIYGDVAQEVRTKDTNQGRVSIRFVPAADQELDEIVTTIADARERHAHYGDIAILVRGNAEGGIIAERLIQENIPVVSDDSLFVKSSVTVRRLVSQLAIVDNPSRAEGNSVAGFLGREMHLTLPTEYHCLVSLAEAVLAELRSATPELCDAESPFIQAFIDWVQEWSRKNGNNLSTMLSDWEEAQPKIGSPEGIDAVRVMTVHKAKGLEFPLVIFPFAEKVALYKPTTYWCKPNTEGTVFTELTSERFRASLSDASVNTLFYDDYVKERTQQAVDNVNIMYVAMTRAKNELKVISAMPPKFVIDAVAAKKDVPAKGLSHLLYAYVKGEEYTSGEPYDYSCVERKASVTKTIQLQYACMCQSAEKRMVFRTTRKDDMGSEPQMPQDSQPASAPAPEETFVEEPTLF